MQYHWYLLTTYPTQWNKKGQLIQGKEHVVLYYMVKQNNKKIESIRCDSKYKTKIVCT